MKIKLVLCLLLVCLTMASCSVDSSVPVNRWTLAKEMNEIENSIKSLRTSLDTLTSTVIDSNNADSAITPWALVKEMNEIKKSVKGLWRSVDTLASTVIDSNNADSDWFAIMTKLATFFKTGSTIYTESLLGAMHVGERLFEGDHGFTKVGQCNSVAAVTITAGFGTADFFPKVEAAIAKDLICFSNMIKHITTMKARTNSSCQPTEDDVIDFIAATLKELFQLRNDGELFLLSLYRVTTTYSIDEFMTELTAKTEVMDQLTRILGTK